LWDSLKIQEWITWLGDIDSTLSLAAVATSLKWSKPTLGKLSIDGLRHPLLEEANTRSQYVTHSVSFDTKGWLIYGVNASGKSSLMKATGIAVILAQAGSFVPATAMSLRPYDAAFSRIWSHDNIWAGLSSFAVEVTELSEILRLATDRSLVLGDEVCSGTESSSATALVAATIEALQAKGTHFMFATHLHDLLKVPGLCQKVSIWHLRVITTPSGKLIYDRSLQPGSGSSCYGLEVAKAMGLPYEIIQRAHDIRRGLEGTVTVQDAPKSRYNSQIQRRACEVCGSNDVRDLEVHHIQPRASAVAGRLADGTHMNNLRNLVVVCQACHDKHHAGELEIGPVKQTSEGPQREVIQKPKTAAPTDDHLATIQAELKAYPNLPASRMIFDLEQRHGIRITAQRLRTIRQAL
jgi:DNA mismatch repair protein MutS